MLNKVLLLVVMVVGCFAWGGGEEEGHRKIAIASEEQIA